MIRIIKYLLPLVLFSCKRDFIEADLIIHHAVIYSVDSVFSTHEAVAVKDGKILYIGTNKDVLDSYSAKVIKDANGKFIFPGFIDAHCHFYGYGKGLNEVDLVGTKSYKEVVLKVSEYVEEHDLKHESVTSAKAQTEKNWIIGRGWDQNDWANKEYPTRSVLDSLYPTIPVVLKRVDGHAVLANAAALNIAKFTIHTKISGGELIIKDGKLTGVLVDNAADSLEKSISRPHHDLLKKALLKAQTNCLAMGLTTVDDAGLEKTVIDAIDGLHKNGQLKMRVYAMLTPDKINLDHYLKNGIYKTEKLTVCAFKYYGDGALGSRGACLLKDYIDKPKWKGFLLHPPAFYENSSDIVFKNGFQMNLHCIGDSAVKLMTGICKVKEGIKNKRWRMEHAQIVSPEDLKLIKELGIIPSVQPTHATSDMYWAHERLGKDRIKFAYSYKDLLGAAGIIALGTDFPVEDISPFKTFYAAVYRKDEKGFPAGGYQMENALSREETLKGMTIWAAYSNFEEKEKGNLVSGKWADFIILDTDLMKCPENSILKTKVLSTFIAGEEVYKN